MRDRLVFLFLGVALGILLYYIVATVFYQPLIKPIFSPGAEYEIIQLINSAEHSVYIEMYVFSSEEVLTALLNAHKRGVTVKIILEKDVFSDENAHIYNVFQTSGIPVAWASDQFKLTHSKFMIIDEKKVFVGSHNFSNSALNLNREASVIISDSSTVNSFLEVFNNDWYLAG